ncbi:MAG: metallophosphoesterase [Treponemataceae bacterium]|nr:metallophosphoesterase [Treponemataceae bacterium]
MISLVQQDSGLIGSADEIAALAKMPNAEILLVSDSHGRKEVLRAIIERFGKNCAAIIFCGDGIGDFCAALAYTKKSKKFAQSFPPVAAFVRGNGDCDFFPVDFNPNPNSVSCASSEKNSPRDEYEIKIPQIQILKIAGMNIFITHGHVDGAYYGLNRLAQRAADSLADIVFYGHTHIASRTEIDLTYFINPGSCALPRGASRVPSFAIVKIPGGQERAETTFFSVRANISEGFEFMPFAPQPLF